MDIYDNFRLYFAIQFMIWFFIAIKKHRERLRDEWRVRQSIDKINMQVFIEVMNAITDYTKQTSESLDEVYKTAGR